MPWSEITMTLAGISAVVNTGLAARAWTRGGLFAEAWVLCYGAIALLSLFYTWAFAVLIWTDIDRGTWSELLTPSSAVSFIIVWIAPGAVSWLEHRTYDDVVRHRHKS